MRLKLELMSLIGSSIQSNKNMLPESICFLSSKKSAFSARLQHGRAVGLKRMRVSFRDMHTSAMDMAKGNNIQTPVQSGEGRLLLWST